jgi:hypothetical protein
MRYKSWTDPLEQQGPKRNMQNDFGRLRRFVMRPQVQLAVQPKDRWQRTRDEPHVIEVGMKKAGMNMRFDEPPVQGVRSATAKKKRVAHIAKRTHVKGG